MIDQTTTSADVIREDLDDIVDRLDDAFDRMAGDHLLVTGGAGFLGYYLVQAALHFNDRSAPDRRIPVTVYDNYIRGIPEWLTDLEGRPDITIRRHDMIDPLPDDFGEPDWIIHAAGIASPPFYRKYPLETMDANINGLRYLLDHARMRSTGPRPVSGMLFYSSSEIYGDPDPASIPTPEDYRGFVSCTGPRACYDESKRYGETLCVTFARQYDIPIRIARPFNNYGPGMKISDRRVIADFARDILAGRDIVMLSDGSPRRTFCYVADAIVGYYRAMVFGGNGEPYNVGVSEPEISMAELAQRMVDHGRELFGYRGRVVTGESAENDYLVDNPQRRCPDISKARAQIGYEPRWSLDEGLRRSLIWYSGHSTAEEA